MNLSELQNELFSNGGFTYSPNVYTPKSGFMVSIPNCEHVVELEKAENKYLFHATTKGYIKEIGSKTDVFFGGWIDDNEVYFDISKHFSSFDEAVKYGLSSNQLAIWDLSKGEEIRLPKPQTQGTKTQQKTYINMWIENNRP